LRADLPLDEPAATPARISRLFFQFEEALSRRLWEWIPIPQTEARHQPANDTADTAADLARLCSGAGGEFTERAGKVTSISLDTPAGYRARAESVGGTTRIWVELASLDKDTSRVSRDAIAVFLLTASGMTRLVRPRVNESEDRFSIVMETVCE